MKKNIGDFDAMLRILIFLVSMIYAIISGAWYWFIPGVVLFATAMVQWCPIHALLDTSTLQEDVQ